MPVWCDAALSAALFSIGLVGVVRWAAPVRRAFSLALMLVGAAWLFVAGSSGQRLDGWAYALLALGALPALCLATQKGSDTDQRG